MEKMIGKVIESFDRPIESGSEIFILRFSDKSELKFCFEPECCERVSLEDICGDFEDLIGQKVLNAYSSSNEDDPRNEDLTIWDSFIWTYYVIQTMAGDVSLRFLGVTNGCYSVEVDLKWK